ncbi:MAG TPA: hypothetical protein VJ851_09580 [Jatrophihabitans sp.]|nr:hypothetical protein [Jatrophihabitans sp.]
MIRTGHRSRMMQPILMCVLGALMVPSMAASCDPTTPAQTAKLDWAVLDADTSRIAEVPANGKVTALASHRVIVTFRASEPAGVAEVAQWAEARWSSVTCRDTVGAQIETGGHVELPRVAAQINPGLYYGFVVRPPLIARQLSCGQHEVDADHTVLNFHLVSGTVRFQGADTTPAGDTHEVYLDLELLPG